MLPYINFYRPLRQFSGDERYYRRRPFKRASSEQTATTCTNKNATKCVSNLRRFPFGDFGRSERLPFKCRYLLFRNGTALHSGEKRICRHTRSGLGTLKKAIKPAQFPRIFRHKQIQLQVLSVDLDLIPVTLDSMIVLCKPIAFDYEATRRDSA